MILRILSFKTNYKHLLSFCEKLNYNSLLCPKKALEDLGIMQKIKRLAGASMGAAIIGKMALGADALDLLESFSIDLRDLVLGGKCLKW